MSLYVIADLHLSTSAATDKSMEVFGSRWMGYTDKLKNNWSKIVNEDDTVVIPGDISWATAFDEAESDFSFLASLPGRKILMKGNHDFWCGTVSKMTAWLKTNHFSDLCFLHNNAIECDDLILCGTRGWYTDRSAEGAKEADYDKMVARECQRLRLSLDSAARLDPVGVKERIVFLHFPVRWGSAVCEPLAEVLSEYAIRRAYFGHIHGVSEYAPKYYLGETELTLISADSLLFTPYLIEKTEH